MTAGVHARLPFPPCGSSYSRVRLPTTVRVTEPTLPVKVIGYVPRGAPAGTVTLALAVVVVPGKAIDSGSITHVVFAGPPLQLNDTVPVNPLSAAAAIVYVVFLPVMDREAGDTESPTSMTPIRLCPDVLALKFASPL